MNRTHLNRREALRLGVAGAGLLVLAPAAGRAGTAAPAAEVPVSANEDLMREHGLLVRLLLVYEAAAGRLAAGDDAPRPVLGRAATTVQRFVENYHERMEERFVFPRFEKTGLKPLVDVLLAQHRAGRTLTARLLELAAAPASKAGSDEILALTRAFSRMYLPHLAREDTVLFPAFHASLPEAAYDEMGERFEDTEHELLGAAGFEGSLAEVAELERRLDIADLARFTP